MNGSSDRVWCRRCTCFTHIPPQTARRNSVRGKRTATVDNTLEPDRCPPSITAQTTCTRRTLPMTPPAWEPLLAERVQTPPRSKHTGRHDTRPQQWIACFEQLPGCFSPGIDRPTAGTATVKNTSASSARPLSAFFAQFRSPTARTDNKRGNYICGWLS